LIDGCLLFGIGDAGAGAGAGAGVGADTVLFGINMINNTTTAIKTSMPTTTIQIIRLGSFVLGLAD
jgi:hypothetical protein